MHTPGPAPAHSLSAPHLRQVLVAVAQMGMVATEQSAEVSHCTH
jgi:hypothetical protein